MSSTAPEQTSAKRSPAVRILTWACIGIVAVLAGYWGYERLDAQVKDFNVIITPSELPADGASSALLRIKIISRFGNDLNTSVLPSAPTVRIAQGSNLVTLVQLGDSLRYRIVAGVQSGKVVLHVTVPGLPAPIEATLWLTPSLADNNGNGYPDVMDLSTESDRTAFRRWFVAIALGQIRYIDDRWSDRDCAGLLRYCYREALKKHDNTWLAARKWLVNPGVPDVKKYNYPNVPLVGEKVFNAGIRNARIITPVGTLQQSRNSTAIERSLSAFHTFAEAARMKDNSLTFIGRSPDVAMPGDVIFYLNDSDSEWPYHTMIYAGGGQTIYHTGPDGNKPGIIKLRSLQELAMHPTRRWHPVTENPYFLGFYRWNILL